MYINRTLTMFHRIKVHQDVYLMLGLVFDRCLFVEVVYFFPQLHNLIQVIQMIRKHSGLQFRVIGIVDDVCLLLHYVHAFFDKLIHLTKEKDTLVVALCFELLNYLLGEVLTAVNGKMRIPNALFVFVGGAEFGYSSLVHESNELLFALAIDQMAVAAEEGSVSDLGVSIYGLQYGRPYGINGGTIFQEGFGNGNFFHAS